MDPQLEDELLMHLAAGTDPLTALAALPHDKQTQSRAGGWWVVAIVVAIVVWLIAV